MSNELTALAITAASLGFFHTLFGPDHYLPFIVMAKARAWSLPKTIWLTVLCGIGHIGSSVVLGLVGVALGIGVLKLESVESVRGNIAAWLLIAFGLVYFIWGVRRAIRNKTHQHLHHHPHAESHPANGGIHSIPPVPTNVGNDFGNEAEEHEHSHNHHEEHLHMHSRLGLDSAVATQPKNEFNITPWVLFTIFVFGPCEPLIPILMYPAAKSSLGGMLMVTAVFGLVTILTMLTIVVAAVSGVNFIPMHRLERYSHALAGGSILLCGLVIQFLGL
ncbi:MAG: hypothetical protein HY762_06565 [Planctomycetes bacterium]|nr:hypothetical protein [Planctomycetota bacterium]